MREFGKRLFHKFERKQLKQSRLLSILIAAALLLTCGVAKVLSRRHALPSSPLSPSQSTSPAVVDIKPVSPKATSVAEVDPGLVSSAIAAVCGADPATADRYEARNDALRTIARNRNLSTNDVATLTDWLASESWPRRAGPRERACSNRPIGSFMLNSLDLYGKRIQLYGAGPQSASEKFRHVRRRFRGGRPTGGYRAGSRICLAP